ncbi:unnamed protein product [Trifolium pratense]|uniref:Uncharacterized protein n=2 Tax=Trifolium pratense TaxID=57577 RepID=A0ACB0LQ73_TRIPR|nr:unnamed protein product [Trifolium pratense]CAJ2671700.1 unnamed protein product [Trifolium pratense]
MARTKNTGRVPAPIPPPTTETESPSQPPVPPPSPISETISERFTTAPNSDTEINQQNPTNSSVELGNAEKIIAETIMKLSQEDVSKSISQSSNPLPKPLIVYTKSKSKSTKIPQVRRSARLLSSGGTKKPVIDNTIYEVNDSDSEELETTSLTRHTKPLSQIIEPSKSTQTTKSAPVKTRTPSKAFLDHLEKYVAEKGKTSSSEEEEAEKNSDDNGEKGKSPEIEEPTLTQLLPKNMVIPLIHYSEREDFDLFWNGKPVPSCRYYDFANLASGGIDVMKLTESQGWTHLFRMRETVYPRVVQAFYFNAKVDPENDQIKSTLRNVEIILTPEILGNYLNLPTDGAKLNGDTWYSAAQVNKKDLIQEMFVAEGAKLPQPPASYLKTEYKVLFNMVQNHIFPRIGTREKVYDGDLMVMHHLGTGKKLNLPYVIIHNMIEAASSGSKKITLPYGMHLTKVFRECNVELRKEKSFNNSKVFDLKNLSHMKKAADAPTVGEKRKREVFEADRLLSATGTAEQSENVLNIAPPENSSLEPTPTISVPFVNLDVSLGFDSSFGLNLQPTLSQNAAHVLEGLSTNPRFTNKALFSPPFYDSQSSSEFLKSLLKIPSPEPSQLPIPLYSADGSLPSFPPLFGSLKSFCSSGQNIEDAAPPADNPAAAGPSTRPKRTKMEKDVSKTKRETTKILEAMMQQNNLLMHIMLEQQNYRTWLCDHVCPLLNIPHPPAHPPPHIPEFPQPENDPSSDASSPTVSP